MFNVSACCYLYKANINSYKSLNFVGVANAFAFMLLIWITIFTIKHEEEEISLSTFISNECRKDKEFARTLAAMDDLGFQETLEEEVITQSQDEF